MTPLDNLRRLVAGWRGEWRVDAHEGITLSHDGEDWPIGALDGDATIVLVELLNAIRPAVDGATAEIERLTAELVQAARAFGLVDRECSEAVACREEARRALLDVGISLGVDVPPLAEIEPVRANWQRYAAATVAAAKATAAARAVPPDVEAAIGDLEHSAFESGHGYGVADMAKMRRHADLRVTSRNKLCAAISAATASQPATVGGLLATARCSCTSEAGDSRCDAHPSCSECGDRTARNVDDCADHCQACASLRRGDAISITSAAAMCSACKARGPIGEVPDAR